MMTKNKFRLMGLAGAAILLFLLIQGASAGQATCPQDNGWTKIDSDDLSLYPVDGATTYCFKAGSDNSQGCTGGIFEEWPVDSEEKICGLSHWSYYVPILAPTPTPSVKPTATPTAYITATPTAYITATPTPTSTPKPTEPADEWEEKKDLYPVGIK